MERGQVSSQKGLPLTLPQIIVTPGSDQASLLGYLSTLHPIATNTRFASQELRQQHKVTGDFGTTKREPDY
jgi:hypothetical protein